MIGDEFDGMSRRQIERALAREELGISEHVAPRQSGFYGRPDDATLARILGREVPSDAPDHTDVDPLAPGRDRAASLEVVQFVAGSAALTFLVLLGQHLSDVLCR